MSTDAPRFAIKGMIKNAVQDSAVAAVTQTPSRPRTRVTLSVAMPVREVIADREDGLIKHEDQDHGLGCDAGRCCQL